MPIIVGNTTSNTSISNSNITVMSPQSFNTANALRNVSAPSIVFPFAESTVVDPRITFTRASSATYFNQAGILTTAASNEPRIDFDPVTGACNGLLIEEARTNSITNNTMAGAVASAAITPQTISSITYVTTTATVTTGAAHGLAINNIVSFSGVVSSDGSGTACPYNGTFYVASVPTSTTFTYTMATTPISNAITVGSYTAKTIGTFPTGWSSYNPPITVSVVGTGYETGIPYIDLNFAGQTAAGQNIYIMPTNSGSVSVGQTWTGTSYLRLVSGTLSGLTFFKSTFNEYNNVSAYLQQRLNNVSISSITNATQLYAFRPSYTYTAANSSVASMKFFYTLIASAGTYNFTLRIGAIQMELGAFPTSAILTSGSAATRAGEVATIPLGSWYNPTASTVLVAAQKNTSADPGYGGVVELNDGSSNNRFEFYVSPNSTVLNFADTYTSNIDDGSINAGSYTLGTPYLAAGAISGALGTTGSHGASLNGAAAVTGTTGNFPGANLTQLQIGGIAGGAAFNMNGWIQRIAYWPYAMSNTQLQAMTS
jgi:hypothetical protein